MHIENTFSYHVNCAYRPLLAVSSSDGRNNWPGEYADRNRAVANQRLSGSNARWKWTTDYNRRSIAETSMYRVKQLFGGSLTLRDYDGQVAEALAMVRALNKMTKAGMPESVLII